MSASGPSTQPVCSLHFGAIGETDPSPLKVLGNSPGSEFRVAKLGSLLKRFQGPSVQIPDWGLNHASRMIARCYMSLRSLLAFT
jgi:hypothetical protein